MVVRNQIHFIVVSDSLSSQKLFSLLNQRFYLLLLLLLIEFRNPEMLDKSLLSYRTGNWNLEICDSFRILLRLDQHWYTHRKHYKIHDCSIYLHLNNLYASEKTVFFLKIFILEIFNKRFGESISYENDTTWKQ